MLKKKRQEKKEEKRSQRVSECLIAAYEKFNCNCMQNDAVNTHLSDGYARLGKTRQGSRDEDSLSTDVAHSVMSAWLAGNAITLYFLL